ncbi:hypothetical protein P3875_01290 [Myroides sp. JBRI-B21084]|uniref:hypothetical protein n=1 Tax=Myroides sp. JBRI-B21084 TaxID=3119977 RepID=UPI0026E1B33A|nr:hypothetical protein [Paenimyroides cloacae]WKW46735.1 hypothetical protein P3875_01290 [Paenimyroides cloacae]
MNILKIKKGLPHGAIREIALRTNTGYLTVLNFFNGKCVPKNKTQILEEALKILREEKEKENQLLLEFESLLAV